MRSTYASFWLFYFISATNEEGSKDKIENDKEVPMKKNSVELFQEPKHDATPFPKGKKEYSL